MPWKSLIVLMHFWANDDAPELAKGLRGLINQLRKMKVEIDPRPHELTEVSTQSVGYFCGSARLIRGPIALPGHGKIRSTPGG
jgi:hypothetical protein